jgi:hypothetical protein
MKFILVLLMYERLIKDCIRFLLLPNSSKLLYLIQAIVVLVSVKVGLRLPNLELKRTKDFKGVATFVSK